MNTLSIYLIAILGILKLQVSSVISQDHVNTIRHVEDEKLKKCFHLNDFSNAVDDPLYNQDEKLDWNSDEVANRYKSSQQKQEAIILAWDRVKKLIKNCSVDIASRYVLGLVESGCQHEVFDCKDYDILHLQRQWNHMFRSDTHEPSWYTKTLFSIKPVLSSNQTLFYDKHSIESRFLKYLIGPKALDQTEREVEHFDIKIELDLDLILKGGFFLESREQNEGIWASNVTEALQFILLHKIGHFEYFLMKNGESHFIKTSRIFRTYDRRKDAELFAKEFVHMILANQRD